MEVFFKQQKLVFDPLMSERYFEYLKSPEWRELRGEVIRRAEFRCEQCGLELGWRGEVHHKSYENLFREVLDDLEYLCPDCHQER